MKEIMQIYLFDCIGATSPQQQELAEVLNLVEGSGTENGANEALGMDDPSLPSSLSSPPSLASLSPAAVEQSIEKEEKKTAGLLLSIPKDEEKIPSPLSPSSQSTPNSAPSTPSGAANANGNDKTFFDGIRYDFRLQVFRFTLFSPSSTSL